MFPSSGLFADIDCPLSKRGLCERPHCPYKHVAKVRGVRGASYKPSIGGSAAGVPNSSPSFACGALVRDVCLQELEQITKEIETVRHEVEKEQRRLSHYQTTQAGSRDSACNFSVSKSETAGERVDGGSYELCSHADFAKMDHTPARKYVVDDSKPRTDLEYDPLSNFSADLRSSNSSGKEQKVKNEKGWKRERDVLSCDQKSSVTRAQPSPSPSPEPLDDFNEECVLIIDLPPSPEKIRVWTQELGDCVAGESQGAVEELKDIQKAPDKLDSPPLCLTIAKVCEVASPCASGEEVNKIGAHCSIGNNLSTLNENKGCENIPADGSVIDLTGCSEDLVTECQDITRLQGTETEVENHPQPASLPASSDQQNKGWDNLVVEEEEKELQVEFPHCSVEKMNPRQPHNFPLKNSVSNKAPAAHSGSPCSQHTKQTQTTDQPAPNVVCNPWCPEQSAPPSASQTPGQVQEGAGINQISSVRNQEQDQASGSNPFTQHPSSTSVRYESSFEPAEQLLDTAGKEDVIIISSDEEEDKLNYSDVELSDSDPMEECYRIFMEANNEEKGNEKHPGTSDGDEGVKKPESNVTPQVLPGRKRVAHEANDAEQPAAKIRPEPRILVPLCGPAASGLGSQSAITFNIQQVQQRAAMLSASVKSGQAFVSSTCQRKPETLTTACPPAPTPANRQPAPVQNAYMNYLSLGTAAIKVGNNLHLLLPKGTFPLPATSSSSPVTSILTPVGEVKTTHVGLDQTNHSAAFTPVQRCRTTGPVLIPALTRKPSPASALPHSSPAASTTLQPAAKPGSAKRKVRQQWEDAKVPKVPHDVRQRYVNMFTEEFLKTTPNVNDAFEKAIAEERTVYSRSVNKLKYLSVAVNSLKRLKNQTALSAKNKNEVNSQRLKGNVPLNLKKLKENGDDTMLYESLKDYILTEEELIEGNFPVQHPEKPASAALFADSKKVSTDPLKRICCRCGATYSVSQTGKHVRKEECNYHYGKGVKNKVPGGVETRYSCCQGVMGAPGCQVFKLHIHDSLSLDGFVSTLPRHPSDTSCPGVYSLDCEMCYTVHGLELSRVTLVNSSLQVVYDTFVRPDNEVIDFNTRFSGISEEDVEGISTSVREVQQTLLSFISADTILIGHSLETDLCTLKLLHGMVVDTSVVFPHRLGPPNKLPLNKLTAEYLRRIIQESVCGHDTAEDAAACMELMLWKVKEDGKLKK